MYILILFFELIFVDWMRGVIKKVVIKDDVVKNGEIILLKDYFVL